MLEFEMVWAFAAFPLPLLVYWLLPAFKDSSEAVRVPFFARVAYATDEKPSLGAVIRIKNVWQKIQVLLCWLLIVTALAKPVIVDAPVVREVVARDMLLIVDLSGSMAEKDFKSADGSNITRLKAVKVVLKEFISRRKGDRLGLAVFGNSAFPQASFTEDTGVIQSLLHELQPNMAGPKTMIGDAIGLGVRLFEASDKNNKVIILLTDGNDSGSKMPVSKAAQIASESGIVIHTVAMGDPATAGEKALDLKTLELISETTDGQFFVALNRLDLESIYATLDDIEPELIDTISFRPKQDWFYAPIAIMLMMNIVFMLIMLRIRRQPNV